MNTPLGIYLHVPFCTSKCSYCDFYSYRADVAVFGRYADTLCEHIKLAGEKLNRTADTLYIGGGTPSLLGGERIAKLVKASQSAFGLKNAEITVECNPADDLKADFEKMASCGVNRISLGVQSAVDGELKALSRRHGNTDVIRTVNDAKSVGLGNISLDLMLGIPHQTTKTLKQSLDFLLSLKPKHISCYMLKIEPNTPFGKADTDTLHLPDEDLTAEMYLFTSEYLSRHGFCHYEISNFALPGYESRHNNKYWLSEEYLGLGPAAYSYINEKRFSFDRNTELYLTSPAVNSDGDGGDFEEFVMLRLRLARGIDRSELETCFGKDNADSLFKKADILKYTDLIELNGGRLRLTAKGFLVSNAVIGKLLY